MYILTQRFVLRNLQIAFKSHQLSLSAYLKLVGDMDIHVDVYRESLCAGDFDIMEHAPESVALPDSHPDSPNANDYLARQQRKSEQQYHQPHPESDMMPGTIEEMIDLRKKNH